MECPKCEGITIKGQAAIRDTLLSMFLVGTSYMSLFFRLVEKTEWKKILHPQAIYESWYCSNCGMLLINSRPRTVNK